MRKNSEDAVPINAKKIWQKMSVNPPQKGQEKIS